MTSWTPHKCSIHWTTRTHEEQGHLTEFSQNCFFVLIIQFTFQHTCVLFLGQVLKLDRNMEAVSYFINIIVWSEIKSYLTWVLGLPHAQLASKAKLSVFWRSLHSSVISENKCMIITIIIIIIITIIITTTTMIIIIIIIII